jgi:hypothetical protein
LLGHPASLFGSHRVCHGPSPVIRANAQRQDYVSVWRAPNVIPIWHQKAVCLTRLDGFRSLDFRFIHQELKECLNVRPMEVQLHATLFGFEPNAELLAVWA